MTRHAAFNHCRDLWWSLGQPFTRLRRKSVTNRCEVGYMGHWPNNHVTIMGAGPMWEKAFENAMSKESK